MPATVVAALPWFPGFYETWLDGLIDRELESEMQETGETYDEVMDRWSQRLAMEALSRGWVKAFSQESGIPMEFDELKSPREYNFTTDRIFVRVPVDAIEKIAAEMDEKPLREVLADKFTSRSGFISFYSPDLEDPKWQKPVRDWDHNQLEALLEARLIQLEHDREDWEETLYSCHQVYEAADAGWIKDRPEHLCAN